MAHNNLNVVFGGSGGLGGAVVRQLVHQGKQVRAVSRHRPSNLPDGVEAAIADASNLEQATQACQGASIVFNCANAPYTDWPQAFPPILEGILEATARAGAKLVFGDNLYMYGPVDGPIHERLPAAATGPKGRVRAQMAATALQAHQSGKVPVAIARGADFYGPGAVNVALGDRVFGAALRGETANLLGSLDAPHSYIFVDDFARGMIELSEHDGAFGDVWHVPAAPAITARDFVTAVYREVSDAATSQEPHEDAKPKMRVAPSILVTAAGWFNPTMREIKEMMYSFEKPYIVDHSKFEHAFGPARTTPHSEAIRVTLDWFRTRRAATA